MRGTNLWLCLKNGFPSGRMIFMIYQIRSTTEEKSLQIAVTFLQEQNRILPFHSILPAPERMFDFLPATCRINCNIRAGAFVTIACTHKQCDVLKCTHKKRSPSLGEISLNGQFHTPANFFGVWRFNMLYAGLTVRLCQIRKAQK